MNNLHPLLHINNLQITVESKPVVHSFSLTLERGTCHALMGPNGSGKSSLAYALMGHPAYIITQGSLLFKGSDITNLSPDKRAQAGLFLSFQHPYEIPGVTVFSFLKAAYEATAKTTIKSQEFHAMLSDLMCQVGIDLSFIERAMNEGFSGGERKRFELLQLLLLNPDLAILDEIDAGLDVDALKNMVQLVNNLRAIKPQLTLIIITHHKRILDYIQPDYVHIMHEGRLVQSGLLSLASRVEEFGYHDYR